MKTIGQVLKLACQYLEEKKSSQGRLEVEHLIAQSLNLKRLDLYLRFDAPLTEKELELIRTKLARLAKGEPLAYIEGHVSFHSLELFVDKRVLIPRPETELMVEIALKKINAEKKVLWDVCTGSGCIGLAIKKARPNLDVVLSDISQSALDVAGINAEKNGLQVELMLGNLLAPFTNRRCDFVLCNPPYVSELDFETLEPHVKSFEPQNALVSGKTGLELYEKLSSTVAQHLNPGAIIWLEIGAGQAEQVKSLFEKQGFSNISVYKDYAQHERIIEIAYC